MGIKWKVCGLRDNILEVASLKPDFVGFIFYPKSPRYVGVSFEMPDFDGLIKKVGVFVNESEDFVYSTMQQCKLDYAQLHGQESPDFCEELKRKGIKIIKAFQIGERFSFKKLDPYESVTDYFLFDAKTEKYGGSGKTFDWQELKHYDLNKEYFLSGGIDLENIDEFYDIDLSKVYALDVNSKFEIKPGLKDIEMLKKLKLKLNG